MSRSVAAHYFLPLTATLLLAACGKAPEGDAPASAESTPAEVATTASPDNRGRIDAQRLQAVATEPGAWLTTGRDGGKTHYSPLDQINRDTADRIGFAWELKTGTNRGMQATPIVVDGVMYTSGVAGRVYALDAKTGATLWQFEPPLELRNARGSCCDIVNRGVAVWQGKVYVGSFEGILYALDAADGKVLWQTDTIVEEHRAYSVTGAPLIAGKVVVIGNGGAEFDSRGYVSAYDLDTGALAWRFYTVPGDPSKPYENPAMEMAAKTWDPARDVTRGGGGNAWDGFAYDADNNLVIFGTANGAPWNPAYRSPAGGDNLFIASLVALKADTGEYVWHYQQTPGEMWDYDATPHIMLATLDLHGTPRKVVMQASKNGFFYVLDSASGTLLAADAFVDVNWATGVDLTTGRPILNPETDYTTGKPVVAFPSGVGGHNFNPMSLSQRTGLVYIPTAHSGMGLLTTPIPERAPERMATGLQVAFAAALLTPEAMPPEMAPITDPEFLKTQPSVVPSAALKAWDPVARKVVWEFQNSSFMDHGGVLSTGGGIVVQGGIDGMFRVFNDETGALIKEIETGSPLIAAPMTYMIDGVQYIAILAGSGGGGWNFWMPGNVAAERGNDNRILVFRLDGGATPVPPLLPPVPPIPQPPENTASAEDIAAGAALFGANCASCHANAERAPVPDLRRSPMIGAPESFAAVVLSGALQTRGMPSWADLLSADEVEKIRAHVIDVARSAYEQQAAGSAPSPESAIREGHL
ncbi:MAG: PQQ-dependent dehydrogenase, methanol/ethanol family [Gammaproteobacteria bacterium]|nr:PQQ-dependent dehydrogenase, methanol/ethanol family [Gammaproteobacteria bacterium]